MSLDKKNLRQYIQGWSNMNPSFLTSSQAARHLNVSIASIRRWDNEGKLKSGRTPGNHRRFSLEELDRFAAEISNPTRGHEGG